MYRKKGMVTKQNTRNKLTVIQCGLNEASGGQETNLLHSYTVLVLWKSNRSSIQKYPCAASPLSNLRAFSECARKYLYKNRKKMISSEMEK